jgi:xanthine dehydrogenase small subunit
MQGAVHFILNREVVHSSLPPATAALDYIRREKRLTGTKEACREGDCGACTILLGELKKDRVEYRPVCSCLLPLADLAGRHLITIEGLNPEENEKGKGLNPIQQALADKGAIQCGFCTPGFVMAITGYFLNHPQLDYREAVNSVDGNICRCTGYSSIKRALANLIEEFTPLLKAPGDHLAKLVDLGLVPRYLLTMTDRLGRLNRSFQRETVAGKIKPAVIVAGGTDLLVQQPELLINKNIEFIFGNREMAGIFRKQDRIYIGSGATAGELMESALLREIFPRLPDYLKLVSSTLIRNRATVGGNILNASPIGDLSVMLLALDASLTLKSNRGGSRKLLLRDFFLDYKKVALHDDELIQQIDFTVSRKSGSRTGAVKVSDSREPAGRALNARQPLLFNFEKVSRRRHLDIAGVNSAISVKSDGQILNEVHLSAGGVAPIPLYLSVSSKFLKGKRLSEELLAELLKICKEEISPITDVRGTAQYKRLLLEQLILAHFLVLFPDIITEELIDSMRKVK